MDFIRGNAFRQDVGSASSASFYIIIFLHGARCPGPPPGGGSVVRVALPREHCPDPDPSLLFWAWHFESRREAYREAVSLGVSGVMLFFNLQSCVLRQWELPRHPRVVVHPQGERSDPLLLTLSHELQLRVA